MATGKDAGNQTTGGTKDSATQGSPKNVDKSPNAPMTDLEDVKTKPVDNAPNATGSGGDAIVADDDYEERRAKAYEFGEDLDPVEGKEIDDPEKLLHARFLVGEDLAYITTTQEGNDVTHKVFSTEKGHDKLRSKDKAIEEGSKSSDAK